jgi:hypothetical protein
VQPTAQNKRQNRYVASYSTNKRQVKQVILKELKTNNKIPEHKSNALEANRDKGDSYAFTVDQMRIDETANKTSLYKTVKIII